jgi:hypothetical protein
MFVNAKEKYCATKKKETRYNYGAMKKLLQHASHLTKRPLVIQEILLLGVILVMFLASTIYVSFPDEFINLIAGQFINEGKWPYIDYFDHHLPMAWYLAAILLKLSFGSFVLFRILWALVIFGSLYLLGRHVKRTNPDIYPFYLFFFFLYPIVALFLWLQLFVADAVAIFFFSIAFWLLLAETYATRPSHTPVYIATGFIFCMIFASLTYIYIAAGLYLWALYLVNRSQFSWIRSMSLIIVSAVPYLYYALHLLVTGQLRDFYIANFYYNTNLYISIPNWERGGNFNPIKFAMTLVHNFYENYLPLLTRVKDFNLFLPIVMVAAWGSFVYLLILFFENKLLFVIYAVMLSFSAPRSNVQEITDADYQSGLFMYLGLIATTMVFFRFKQIITENGTVQHLTKQILVGVLAVYTLFATIFLLNNLFNIVYNIYTQQMPRIYDTSHAANFIEEITDEGDIYWMGPYEPHHVFFVDNRTLPGKFPSLLPQFREDPVFADAFLDQFKNNPPKIIIFKGEASIFNTPSTEFGQFFLDWMKDKYVRIEDLAEYEELRSPSEFNLKADLYINREHQEEVLKKLREKGYISRK